MRLILASISILICGMPALRNAAERSQADRDYDLGVGVGECVAAKCQILRGTLPATLPKSGESVRLLVAETLLGTPAKGTVVDVPYEAYPEVFSGDHNLEVANAWSEVKMVGGLTVTIIMALGDGFGVRAGEPVWVVADGRDAEIVRSLAVEAAAINAAPALLDQAVASLASTPNYALAGYLFMHAAMTVATHAPEQGVGALVRMLATPSVPPEESEPVVRFIVLDYFRLSGQSQADVVRGLTECTHQADVRKQLAALGGLARIAGFDKSVNLPPLPASLRDAYRTLVKSGGTPRNGELEAALGIKQ
jgi:hypothetical protein